MPWATSVGTSHEELSAACSRVEEQAAALAGGRRGSHRCRSRSRPDGTGGSGGRRSWSRPCTSPASRHSRTWRSMRRATKATVRLSHANGSLAFEVIDDGVGFDPVTASHGSGLQGIADRLAALGGSVKIRGAPGPRHDGGGPHPRRRRRAHEPAPVSPGRSGAFQSRLQRRCSVRSPDAFRQQRRHRRKITSSSCSRSCSTVDRGRHC